MVEKEFTIEGMNCQHCVMAVRKELAKIEGVDIRDVRIGSASLAYDEKKIDVERIKAAVTAAGYKARF